jgi:SAM-dependent methyltransferase
MAVTEIEIAIAHHYGQAPVLRRIDAALRRAGLDPRTVTAADLKPLDEFHTGGLEATEALLSRVAMRPELQVVDIGCGIGGTVRHVAAAYGATAIGIDVTLAYIDAGRALTDRVGLADRVTLAVGSATELPLPDAVADLALMIHVGMNVADKARLMAEVARVLRPEGRFALLDVMRGPSGGDLVFPLPWATSAQTAFVAPPEAYRAAAAEAGFVLEHERERGDEALEALAQTLRRAAQRGFPPLGQHILMGETALDKLKNCAINVEARRVMPVEMVFVRSG